MSKSRKTIGWIVTILAVVAPAWGVVGKFSNEEMQANMASIGFEPYTQMVAIFEFVAVVLFVIPKTGRIGTILMTMLMSGAIAAHVGHDQTVGLQSAVLILVWAAAIIRYPDLIKVEG